MCGVDVGVWGGVEVCVCGVCVLCLAACVPLSYLQGVSSRIRNRSRSRLTQTLL